ncbi:MAG: site-specific integrase [Ruminococcus sp.]|uniref:site-specific integrase n=1 Tax=Ruminococcus sp. TaxID=41978 RepID=UPI0025D7C416|nr:site-specific integrase [Ruminococcus sp.]MBO4865563.1 site-specific integrase [Ruminococcus sp.]
MKAQKLPSGRFRTQVIVGKDANGKRISKSFTADTAFASEKMAMDYVSRYGAGQAIYRMTVAGAINQYIESRTNTVSPVTIQTYKMIRDTRLQAIMDRKITELSVPDVQLAVNVDAARLSGKSISEAVSLLQAALTFQGIETNFKKRVTFPKSRQKKKLLPPPEIIIRTIKGTKYELACLLAMWLSLRISEIRGLQYGDISKDGKWLSIQRSIVYSNGVDHHNDFNKTEGSTRTVSLPKELYEMIMVQPHDSDTDPIVPHGYNCLYKGFRRLMAAQGYEMKFHDLRAVFATTLKGLQIPDDYVQHLGGWSNPTTMYKHYVQTLTSEEEKYQKQIDEYFSGALDTGRSPLP